MKIECIHGDITKMKADIIVNAANSSLLGGGGVDGAIHKAGGSAILDACREVRARQGGCATGEAVITTAGRLAARFVIHTVGPVWQGGKAGERGLLASCYQNSLKLAEINAGKTIAFPNISTGIYGFPKKLAAEIALNTVYAFEAHSLAALTFVCFDQENYKLYQALMAG